ncbi:MAG: conjugal transfer protein TraX [Ruminococcus sp.]|nr:conjugal transfer protein TraX [Ruminococcus sp.]
MLIDHTAHIFVPYGTLLYTCMRFVGRTTAPVMCFFISEGYHHTRNLKKYFQRMAVFAVISHFAFSFCFRSNLLDFGTSSMITTLLLSLFAVHVLNSEKFDKAYKLPLLLFIAYLAQHCDWGYEAVIYTLVFEIARESRKKQLTAYTGAILVFKIIPFISAIFSDISYFFTNWQQLGVILPIPLILLYNGERGGGKYTKWVFYIFYPAHLILLGYLNIRYIL